MKITGRLPIGPTFNDALADMATKQAKQQGMDATRTAAFKEVLDALYSVTCRIPYNTIAGYYATHHEECVALAAALRLSTDVARTISEAVSSVPELSRYYDVRSFK